MREQNDSDRLPENSDIKTSSEKASKISDAPQVKTSLNSENKCGNSKPKAQMSEGLIWRPAERWHIAINIITALFVLSAAIIYWFQLREMVKSTEASRIAAQASEESVKQSKASLDATIESYRLDQRAWVGMTEILPEWKDTNNKPIFIKEGAHYRVGVTVVNSGKTPALKVRSRMRLMSFSANDKFVPDFENAKTQSVGVLQPQGKFHVISKPSYRKIRASDIAPLKSGSIVVYLYGEILYEDIFGIAHQTTYCSVLSSTLDSFLVHSDYNDAN